MLTGVRDEERRKIALQAGGIGFIAKDRTPEARIKATEKLYAADTWLDRSGMTSMLAILRRGGSAGKGDRKSAKIRGARVGDEVELVNRALQSDSCCASGRDRVRPLLRCRQIRKYAAPSHERLLRPPACSPRSSSRFTFVRSPMILQARSYSRSGPATAAFRAWPT